MVFWYHWLRWTSNCRRTLRRKPGSCVRLAKTQDHFLDTFLQVCVFRGHRYDQSHRRVSAGIPILSLNCREIRSRQSFPVLQTASQALLEVREPMPAR
jgi:hypothetical protein